MLGVGFPREVERLIIVQAFCNLAKFGECFTPPRNMGADANDFTQQNKVECLDPIAFGGGGSDVEWLRIDVVDDDGCCSG